MSNTTSKSEDQRLLETLVNEGHYDDAVRLCQARTKTDPQRHFWEMQLAYVLFLNEHDDEAYYLQCPQAFEVAVQHAPADSDAHFWLGYVKLLVHHDTAAGREELARALALDGTHPYANLVLAGIQGGASAIPLLRQVLIRQPGNHRALRELAQNLAESGYTSESQAMSERLRNHHPYVEHGYGIMNGYINEVLTEASRPS
jgi:cytochrome c-type biogenesis protein CcmH/NrfG